jgi:hypothetical protein
MLKIAAPGRPAARRPGAFCVADLDQVAEGVAGLVASRFMPVVAVSDRERLKVDEEVAITAGM